jgi:GNAT superfamily N-acetyltransferase
LATTERRPTGGAVAVAEEAAVPFAVVEDLIAPPEARGRGVGKAMLDWIAAEARARGVRRLFLEAASTTGGRTASSSARVFVRHRSS